LAWFDANGPDYPWRRAEDDPFAVLVSEVMLQQTQATRVEEIFPRFMARFPTVARLADASPGDVVRAWAGLGYHRRAVALHEAARAIIDRHGGEVPRDLEALRALPGVGPYTAAAVASIAYGVPVATVDTNARKVLARLDHGAERDEITPREAAAAAEGWLDGARPGDWNQAVMNLGRDVCLTAPRCDACPLARVCRFRAAGRTGRPSVRRQPAFEGSMRQVRGAVVSQLRDHPTLSIARLTTLTGYDASRVTEAVAALHRDRVVTASARSLAGDGAGRVRLPR
jgi:A/G-specific adenine glycosylase